MSDEENEHSTEESREPDEQPVGSESSQESEASGESAEQSDTQTSDEVQPTAEQSRGTTTDESEQTGEQPDESADQTSETADEQGGGSEPVAEQATATGELNAKRQVMLDLINKWMPTSLNNPRVPEREIQDPMAKAGWTKARGQQSKEEKDAGGHPVTSCGDILAAMLTLWKSNFVGAFAIRDQDSKGRTPGAKGLGYYVEADGTQAPQPGDIIVLRNGVSKGSAGSVGHVGILVEAGETEWRTADGGGGTLPDQTASVTTRTVRLENSIPILKSPTDLYLKRPDEFLWAGLGRLAGGAVVSGSDLAVDGGETFLTKTMIRIGKAVFNDLAWQHEAFLDVRDLFSSDADFQRYPGRHGDPREKQTPQQN